MTDHLAKIAARTMECPDCRGEGMSPRFRDDTLVPHAVCKGSGRVLDPRFKGLRKQCFNYSPQSTGHINLGCICKGMGYTVVRDLAVLLEIAAELIPVLSVKFQFPYKATSTTVIDCFLTWDGMGLHAPTGTGITSLEAAAKAVWEWLER